MDLFRYQHLITLPCVTVHGLSLPLSLHKVGSESVIEATGRSLHQPPQMKNLQRNKQQILQGPTVWPFHMSGAQRKASVSNQKSWFSYK